MRPRRLGRTTDTQSRFSAVLRAISMPTQRQVPASEHLDPLHGTRIPSVPVKPEDGKTKVSEGGGTYSRWRRDGGELFYFNSDKMMAVDVSAASGFKPGVPVLFPIRMRGPGGAYHWDLSSDGQRFLVSVAAGERMESPSTIVTNWQSLLYK